jgi:hypothetical protein
MKKWILLLVLLLLLIADINVNMLSAKIPFLFKYFIDRIHFAV